MFTKELMVTKYKELLQVNKKKGHITKGVNFQRALTSTQRKNT